MRWIDAPSGNCKMAIMLPWSSIGMKLVGTRANMTTATAMMASAAPTMTVLRLTMRPISAA